MPTEKFNWHQSGAIDILRKLWGNGLPASAIAGQLMAQFKGDLTRSAVLGKVHRLGISVRAHGQVNPTSCPLNLRPRKPARIAQVFMLPVNHGDEPRGGCDVSLPPPVIRTAAAPPPPTPIDPGASPWEALPGTQPVPLLALESHHCRWPVGELFCAATKLDGSSYCPHHAGISGQPWARREARRAA